MAIEGDIWSFDLAARCGVAYGRAMAATPESMTVVLKKDGEPQDVAFANLIAFLHQHWSYRRPGLVFKEAPLPLQGYFRMRNSEARIRMDYGLHAVLEAMCVRFSVPWREKAPSSIRKHFVGRAHAETRADTKAAVIARCKALGFLPVGSMDDNRADAIAGWDYAAQHFGKRVPEALHLFGEVAA